MDRRTETAAAAEWRRNWRIVAAASAGMALAALPIASVGVMMAPLEQEFGWSRANISTGPSLAAVVSMALTAFAGLLIDRLGARVVGIAAASIICLAVGLLSQVSGGGAQWWLLWTFVGVGSAAMPIVWLAPISRLFSRGRGFAVAVVLSGAGFSSSLVPIVANALVANFGWRIAYLALASAWGLMAIPLVLLFFRLRDEPCEERKRAVVDSRDRPSALPGLTVSQGFRSAAFYKLTVAVFVTMFTSSALVMNLIPILNFQGMNGSAAAAIAGMLGVATLCGRLAGGYLTDRLGARVAASCAMLLSCLFPAALLFLAGSPQSLVAAVLAYGATAGVMTGAIVCLASGHFGVRAFGVLYGFVNAATALGIALGPLLANHMYDAFVSYRPVLWAAIPLMILSGLLYASLGVFPKFDAPSARDDDAVNYDRES